jgi:hypothetical protein
MAFDPYAPGAIMELTDHGRLDASAPDFADRLAAKLERRGYEPHIARALGKKAAAEHDALRDPRRRSTSSTPQGSGGPNR